MKLIKNNREEDVKEKDFASVGERERYINATINRQIKQIGADQPWYSPAAAKVS